MNTLSSAIIDFSFKFLNELEKNKNVVSSPLSAEFVLALLTLGTTDPAHSELLATLGFADHDSIRASFTAVTAKLKSINGITINVANKVYIKEGPYDLQPQLKEDAVNIFDTDMEKVDFNDSASIDNINTWVENKTKNKIKNLLSKDNVEDNTRLVLVNALYFKGTWKDTFQPSHTEERPFHLNENSTVQVPMMHKKDKYSWGHSEYLCAQLLEIPYLGDEASMLIVLPRQIEGLDDVLAKLAAGYVLTPDIEGMVRGQVMVTIPKFKIETEIDLKELLPKLGIKAIFDEKDSGLTKLLNKNEPLYVSTAIQKACIEVNEEGAEAAVATAVRKRVLLCKPVMFQADRPFLYVLLGLDRVPLFVGVYRGIA